MRISIYHLLEHSAPSNDCFNSLIKHLITKYWYIDFQLLLINFYVINIFVIELFLRKNNLREKSIIFTIRISLIYIFFYNLQHEQLTS